MQEKWKDVVGFEGYYEVSNYGSIRGVDRVVIRKNGSKCTINGVKITLCVDKKGYHRFRFRKPFDIKTLKIHRVVAQAFLLNYSNELQVNHIDGNKTNNRIDNIEMVTNRENSIHAHKTGLIKKRESFSNKKTILDIYQVLSIYSMPRHRKNSKDVFTMQYIADCFNVSMSCVSKIATGKKHKYLYGKIFE